MTASLNRAYPAQLADLKSDAMREQFGAIADDIEALQTDKQDTLVSGTNIKTVNGTSLLGSGDVVISGGAVDSVAGRTGVVVLTKADVSLSNVDDTSDATKPVSAAQAAADAATLASANATTSAHAALTNNPHSVTKAQVGLGSVEDKSSATIRGELTSGNVTTALGFTPASAATNTGTNTGDETGARVAALLHAASDKPSLVDADEVSGTDSAASFGLIRTTWTNVKAFLKTYFDALYAPKGAISSTGITMSTARLLGRSTAATGAIEEITLGTNLSFTGTTLNAAGGGAGATINLATLDFGPAPGSNEASVTITGQTGITADHRPTAAIVAGSSGSHDGNDAAYAAMFIALTCSYPIAATGYTIQARSTEKLTGTFEVAGQWS